jgi:peptide-methionine (S)-S-oxide reductase
MHTFACTLLLTSIAAFVGCDHKEVNVASEANPVTPQELDRYPAATFAGGCFWGVEYNFRRIPGVLDTKVGFMGGQTPNPTYKQVCYEDTGHAEVVHLWYDPDKISYEKLVKIFFILHDPTTLNRQGPDVGDQYRSAIFFHTPQQQETARQVIAELTESGAFRRPIVTEVTAAAEFWQAEDYHQQYIAKNPLRSCHIVDQKEIRKILDEE